LAQDAGNKFEYEIIIVLDQKDNESEGRISQEALKNKRLKVYRSGRPGVSCARNLGIKASEGEIIYFLDDDCLLPRGNWLIQLYENFKNNPGASAIGGGYLFENKEKDIFCMCRNALDNFYVEANSNTEGLTGALLGGNTAYKRAVFLEYGYFDENIRYGSAETEFNDRIVKGSGKLYFIKELAVLHAAGKQSLRVYFLKSFMQGKGKAFSIHKNGFPGMILNNKPRNMWFARIAWSLDLSVVSKVLAAAFLFLNSLCYRSGMLIGRFYRNR